MLHYHAAGAYAFEGIWRAAWNYKAVADVLGDRRTFKLS